MTQHNAHVLEYLFWQLKKDAVWYWFPYKSYRGGVVKIPTT